MIINLNYKYITKQSINNIPLSFTLHYPYNPSELYLRIKYFIVNNMIYESYMYMIISSIIKIVYHHVKTLYIHIHNFSCHQNYLVVININIYIAI